MTYLGDFRLGATFDTKFTTVNTSGVPTALASGTIAAYPGNSTTEVTAGITLSASFDSRTGLNNVRVVASSGNGYTTATDYALVITVGTVDGNSVVGYVIGHFSIENRSALMPTTAARTLDVSAGGEAGMDWANVGSPTSTVGLSGTTVKTATDVATAVATAQNDLDTLTGADGATLASAQGNYAPAKAGDEMDLVDAPNATAVSAIQNGLASQSSVDDVPTNAELSSALGGLNDPTAGEIADAVCDEALSGHTTAGTVGKAISDILVDTAEIGAAGVGLTEAGGDGDHLTAIASVGAVAGNVGGNVAGSVASVTAGVTLADDAITASKYDESTAFPLASADSGSTEVARTGADSDTLETLSDQIDGLSTAAAPQLLQNTTIATLAGQADFTLTAGSDDDDAYNGAIVVVTDQSTATQKAVGTVQNYTGSTRRVELVSDPGIFTMAAGDTVDVLAAISNAPTAAAIRAEIDSNSTQLAAIVADTADIQPKIGTPAADLAADIAAVKSQTGEIETDTQDLQSRVPAALVSGRMASDAIAISGSTAAADAVETNIGNLDDAITDAVAAPAAALAAYDPPTNTELEARTLAAASYATAAAQTTAQNDLDLLTGADGATLATSQPNYAPAKAGDQMALANDAITAAKYDESTAFPLKSADAGSTAVARTGADADTLETLSDQLDSTASQASVNGLENLSQAEAQTAAAAALTAAEPVEANVKQVNDVTLTGDGAGTPWGPA